MIKPSALQEGDQIAILAPAGPPDKEQLAQGIRVLEKMGLDVIVGRHVFDEEATEQKRLEDVHEAFFDPKIHAIFCANGGFGSAKITPMIDYEKVRQHPKVFWGYSDLTYLLNAIQKHSGLVTFHGPMVAPDLNDEQRAEETVTSFSSLFTGESPTYQGSLHTLAEGEGEGHLVGGNLTLLTNGLGTPYQVDAKGAILLIEEIQEPAFLIDLKLTHLKQAGVFEGIQGVVLGHFQMEAEEYEKAQKVLQDFFRDAPYPVAGHFPFGHDQPNQGVPLGVEAKLTTSPPRLVVESGVKER